MHDGTPKTLCSTRVENRCHRFKGMSSSDIISVYSPATGEHVGDVPAHTADFTRKAFAAARNAQKQWVSTSLQHRKAVMLRLHDMVLERQSELMDVIQSETGKNRASAFDEVLDVAITARHYAYAAPRMLRTRRKKGALPVLTHTVEEHVPHGVVGIIAPWNYPLTLTASDAIPALLAGNGVVLKPDSLTPLTALKIAELLYESGIPRDLFHVVSGSGGVVGRAITEGCDYLMFTGSTMTGRRLGSIAGERLIGYSAELGGKNPMIVAHDADIERAVQGAISACFSNSGQLCVSIERIYVHEAIAQEFLERFVAAIEAMRIGPGPEWDVDMGSLISAEHRERVEDMVNDAVTRGATVLAGGRALPDLGEAFYAPTVLTNVAKRSKLYREEVFGPVVYVETVDSISEAIQRANDSEYGLNASVFADPDTAWEIASQLEVGTVNINEGYAATWGSIDAPMGGWKASGVGRRHGDEGLLKYTTTRTVSSQRVMPVSGPGEVAGNLYLCVEDGTEAGQTCAALTK